MLRKSILIGLFILNTRRTNRRTKITLGRVGEAIVLTCLFTAGYGRHRKLGVGFRTAGYGRHRSQWSIYFDDELGLREISYVVYVNMFICAL